MPPSKDSVNKTSQSTQSKRNNPRPLDSQDFGTAGISQLQRSLGNQGMIAMLQTQLKVGASDDFYEREADSVADAVMRQPSTSEGSPEQRGTSTSPPEISRLREGTLRRESNDLGGSFNTNESFDRTLSKRNVGNFLPVNLERSMGSKIGADFSGVRIHDNPDSHAMNRQINANAFTHGHDIYFGEGQYHPETTDGQRTIAHELTHTVQQGGSIQRSSAVSGGRSLAIQRETDIPPDAVPPETAANSVIGYTRINLSEGDEGDDVLAFQELLKASGNKQIKPDGAFGPRTKAAVLLAQKQSGLKEDGITSMELMAFLGKKSELSRGSASVQSGDAAAKAIRHQKALKDSTLALRVANGSKYVESLKSSGELLKGGDNKKVQTLVTLAETLLAEGYEPAFVAGMLANSYYEGTVGMFERIYANSTGTSYYQVMVKEFKYHTKYTSNKGVNIYDDAIRLSEVKKMRADMKEYNRPGKVALSAWKKRKKAAEKRGEEFDEPEPEFNFAKFGLGSIQWTSESRQDKLMAHYEREAGGNDSITVEQAMKAEASFMLAELSDANQDYISIYSSWKEMKKDDTDQLNSLKLGSLDSPEAAQVAASRLCRNYVVPSSMEEKVKERIAKAASIYKAMLAEP